MFSPKTVTKWKGYSMPFSHLGTEGCLTHQFTCGNKRCIPSSEICDGNNDCGDFSDEIYPCSGKHYEFTHVTEFYHKIILNTTKLCVKYN